MDLDALRTFVEVERSGGVTRAAEVLFRSQPAVSRRVAQLERELGVPVFERVASGMTLTEAGRALLPFAERVLATVSDAEAAVRAVRDEGGGELTIALVGTLASSGLTPLLRRFAERHPRVDLRLRTATSDEVGQLVRRAEATLGLRYSEDPHPDLVSKVLYRERMRVAVGADHRRAGKRVRSLTALAGERWLAFPRQPGRPEASAAMVDNALIAAGVPEEAIRRIDSLTAQKRLIEAGFGIGLVPETAIEEERAAGTLAVIDVGDLDLGLPVVLVTRKGGYLGSAARTFVTEAPSAPSAPSGRFDRSGLFAAVRRGGAGGRSVSDPGGGRRSAMGS